MCLSVENREVGQQLESQMRTARARTARERSAAGDLDVSETDAGRETVTWHSISDLTRKIALYFLNLRSLICGYTVRRLFRATTRPARSLERESPLGVSISDSALQ